MLFVVAYAFVSCANYRSAFCAAEMAEELFRNLSEKLPLKGLAPDFGVEPSLV